MSMPGCGVRVRAAQRDAPQHVVQPQVAAVGELAGDLRRAVGRGRSVPTPPSAASGPSVVDGRGSRALRGRGGVPGGASSSAVPAGRLDDDPAADQQQLQRRRRAEDQRGDRVGDAGVARPSTRHSARSASLPGSSEPISSSRPRHRRRRWSPSPAPRGRSAPSGRRGRGATAAPGAPPRAGSPASLEAAPSTPSPTGTPASSRSRRGDAGAQPGVGRRAVRHAGAGRAEPATSPVERWTACASHTSSPEPAELVEVLDRRAAEPLAAELLLVQRLGEVGVQAHAERRASAADSVISVGGDRERRARRERDPHHRPGRGVVEPVDRVLGGGQDRVEVLDHGVGRQAALRTGPGPSSRGSGGTAARPAAASTVAASRSPPPCGKT